MTMAVEAKIKRRYSHGLPVAPVIMAVIFLTPTTA
jgi:hypothetical protein